MLGGFNFSRFITFIREVDYNCLFCGKKRKRDDEGDLNSMSTAVSKVKKPKKEIPNLSLIDYDNKYENNNEYDNLNCNLNEYKSLPTFIPSSYFSQLKIDSSFTAKLKELQYYSIDSKNLDSFPLITDSMFKAYMRYVLS